MAGLYDYLQGGPTLSGIKQQAGSLSGVLPGAISQGDVRSMQPFQQAPGVTYGYGGVPGAVGGQPGQPNPLARSIATSLSPNLMQTFGVYADQAPQQSAGYQGVGPSPYYGLGTMPGGARDQELINNLLSRAGASTVAEEQQIAANRTPGESPIQTASRMQLSPQAQLSAILGGGLGTYNTLQGAQQFMANPTATSGLGTLGAGLRTAGAFGSLAGLDPQALSALGLAGSVAGLGSTLTNPEILSKLAATGPYGSMYNLTGGANIASGLFGVGGALNNMLGGDPRLGAGLSLGGNLASLAGAMGTEAATGALASSGGVAMGTGGAGMGLGTTLGIAALPWAIGSVFKSFTDAAKAKRMKEYSGMAQQAMTTLKASMPKVEQALVKLRAGDTSQLGFLTDMYKVARQGKVGMGYVNRGVATPFDKYATGLFTNIQKANPTAYESALRMGFAKQQGVGAAPVNPFTGAPMGIGGRVDPFTGKPIDELTPDQYANAPIERIYQLMGYGAPQAPGITQLPQYRYNNPYYMPAPTPAWSTYQFQQPVSNQMTTPPNPGYFNPASPSPGPPPGTDRGTGGWGVI